MTTTGTGITGSGRTALVIGDVQVGLVGAMGAEDLVGRLRACADAARANGVAVVFVVVRLRPGHPEVHPVNAGFLAAAASGMFEEGSDGAALHPGLGAVLGEPLVVKRRVSGFYGTDLDVVLRSMGVGHVVLGGLTTAGVVLSTFRDAADRDYAVTVLSDGCADGDGAMHDALMERLFPKQAEILDCAAWIASIEREGMGR
jgi:nicotinamidase-related amidase